MAGETWDLLCGRYGKTKQPEAGGGKNQKSNKK
jgi:hypothetical protein